MDSGIHSPRGGAAPADEHPHSTTEPISFSSLFNPTHQPFFLDHPSSSYLPPLNPTNIPIWSRNTRPGHPSFTGLDATDHNNCLNSQPLVITSNTSMGRVSNHHQPGVSTKNPKKRTRASKRPPTTVLTTDTSNFRQMVQEFTGIPTPPFSSYSGGFDRTGGGGLGPWYRVPPARQKIQLQQPCFTTLGSQNPKFLFQEYDDQGMDVLRGFAGSSTHWKGANENLLAKQDEYELNLNTSNVLTHKGFDGVISLGDNDGDQAQVNVDSWVLPF